MQRYAKKVKKVVLAEAVFDKQGRVLVSRDGLLPIEQITDAFVEQVIRSQKYAVSVGVIADLDECRRLKIPSQQHINYSTGCSKRQEIGLLLCRLFPGCRFIWPKFRSPH